MKKMTILAAVIMMACSAHAFDLKSLLGGNKSTTTTQTTTTAASETNNAKNSGAKAGSALNNLYKAYMANDKKIDTKDISTYTNLLALLSNTECLKENYKDKTFMGSYSLGLVEGSLGLVKESNQEVVTNALVEIANQAVGDDKVAAAASTASSLSSIFGLFK